MMTHCRCLFLIVFFILLAQTFYSCTPARRGLFAKRSPHERYEDNLAQAGIKTTAMGRQWFAAAEKAIQSPLSISLPYKETGYFAAETPEAAGYVFTCSRGEKLNVTLAQTPQGGCRLFVDVWQYNSNKTTRYLQSADTLSNALSQEIEEDGSYLLRLQPELLCGTQYTLTITTAPTLAFPVPSSAKPRVESVWGDDRDAGARRHEGIDIFAPRRTPVVAASAGYVTRVNENRLGGKVIFMRPSGKDFQLYYAHLDSQIAREGQVVKAGDTLGLMGNTGNASTTSPHLHFGIYTSSGAINPLPFVQNTMQTPYNITAPLQALNSYAHTARATTVYAGTSRLASKSNIAAFAPLRIIAATANWYKVVTADSNHVFISSDNVSTTPYRKIAIPHDNKIYDRPSTAAAVKHTILRDTVASVMGNYAGFYLVKYKENMGWVRM